MEKRPLPHEKILFVCTNDRPAGDRVSCGPCGGAIIRDRLKELVKSRGLKSRIRVSQSGCMDRCEKGPNVMVFPDNVWYCGVSESDVDALLDEVIEGIEPS